MPRAQCWHKQNFASLVQRDCWIIFCLTIINIFHLLIESIVLSWQSFAAQKWDAIKSGFALLAEGLAASHIHVCFLLGRGVMFVTGKLNVTVFWYQKCVHVGPFSAIIRY